MPVVSTASPIGRARSAAPVVDNDPADASEAPVAPPVPASAGPTAPVVVVVGEAVVVVVVGGGIGTSVSVALSS